jgi:hypothetical protein
LGKRGRVRKISRKDAKVKTGMVIGKKSREAVK